MRFSCERGGQFRCRSRAVTQRKTITHNMRAGSPTKRGTTAGQSKLSSTKVYTSTVTRALLVGDKTIYHLVHFGLQVSLSVFCN